MSDNTNDNTTAIANIIESNLRKNYPAFDQAKLRAIAYAQAAYALIGANGEAEDAGAVFGKQLPVAEEEEADA